MTFSNWNASFSPGRSFCPSGDAVARFQPVLDRQLDEGKTYTRMLFPEQRGLIFSYLRVLMCMMPRTVRVHPAGHSRTPVSSYGMRPMGNRSGNSPRPTPRSLKPPSRPAIVPDRAEGSGLHQRGKPPPSECIDPVEGISRDWKIDAKTMSECSHA